MVICLERGADCLHMVQLMPLLSKTPSSLASCKSRLVSPFWYQLTQVVLEKRPLNVCSAVVVVESCQASGLSNGSLISQLTQAMFLHYLGKHETNLLRWGFMLPEVMQRHQLGDSLPVVSQGHFCQKYQNQMTCVFDKSHSIQHQCNFSEQRTHTHTHPFNGHLSGTT